MMDGTPLFPEDHHPIRHNLSPDIAHFARCYSRLERPVKYYFIDFGMSTHFEEGDSPYVLGAKGGDQDPPELSNEVPYNAFMLDIYILGHLYELKFLQVGDNVHYLVTSLTKDSRHITAWTSWSHSSPP